MSSYVDTLNTNVSQAIFHAESLDSVTFPDKYAAAWRAVRQAETMLAVFAPTRGERMMALRGVYSAAERAGETDVVEALTEAHGVLVFTANKSRAAARVTGLKQREGVRRHLRRTQL